MKDLVRGKVKRWLGFRGYGFIDSEEHDEEIFVHASDVQGKDFLEEGETVEFDVVSTYKGPKAVNVKPVTE